MLCQLVSRPAFCTDCIEHYGVLLKKLPPKSIERLQNLIPILDKSNKCVFQLNKPKQEKANPKGYSIVSLAEFTQNSLLTYKDRANVDLRILVNRIQAQIQNHFLYSLPRNNCEHAARYVFEGKHYSTQIEEIKKEIDGLILWVAIIKAVESTKNQTKIVTFQNLNST